MCRFQPLRCSAAVAAPMQIAAAAGNLAQPGRLENNRKNAPTASSNPNAVLYCIGTDCGAHCISGNQCMCQATSVARGGSAAAMLIPRNTWYSVRLEVRLTC